MARFLKQGKTKDEMKQADHQVSQTVSGILSDIENRGDAAVRQLSAKFDKWEPETFRLSTADIEAIMSSVPETTLEDIKFAQAQIRRFAEAQRAALRDLEIETLPGVTLGHKNIPVNSVGCYIPGDGILWWLPRI